MLATRVLQFFNFTVPRGDIGAAGSAGADRSARLAGVQGDPGLQGASGTSAWTLVGPSGFTVPAYGGNVVVTVGDSSWMALGEWIYY